MATMMQDEYLADAQNISRTAPVIRLKFEEHREYIVINNTLKHRKLIFKISSNNVINLKNTPKLLLPADDHDISWTAEAICL